MSVCCFMLMFFFSQINCKNVFNVLFIGRYLRTLCPFLILFNAASWQKQIFYC